LSERPFAPATWLLIASLPALALLSGACKYTRLFGDAGAGGTGAAGAKGVQEPASQALALYGQRQADLHDESENGPVIGRIYPGALVTVVTEGPPVGSGYRKIALPGFRAATAARTQVVAVVEASALGTKPQPLQGPSTEGRLVRDFVMNSPLWAAELMPDSAPAFASTLCGEIRVLALGTRRSKISQYHAGVELIGWYDYLIDVDNYCPLHRCNQRFVVQDGQSLSLTGMGSTQADKTPISAPPEGFVHAEFSDTDPLAERIKRRLPVYWLTQTKAHTARCSRWTFDGVTEGKAESGARKLEARMRSDLIVVEGKKTLPSFVLSYEPGSHLQGGTLLLAGLNFNQPGTPAGAQVDGNSYRGMMPYSFVGANKDALRLLEGEWASNKDLVAWHPDDEERWFLSEAACNAAARAAESALSAGAPRLPGGFHWDCFKELHE